MRNWFRRSLLHTRRMRARTSLLPESIAYQAWPLKCHFLPLSQPYSDIQNVATDDNRSRLSRFWVPTGGISPVSDEDSHSKLVRAGFLRQAHSGIFHMLPLGRRVQDKLEALIDRHMSKLAASKLALSSISSQELWEESGRLGISSELFRFEDRKNVAYLLAPTHEEEITSLVASTVKSYKELPLRLYQISRKYRDELRPRHGLLRSREFIMKDLYTFDYSIARALATYDEVRNVYARFFDELKVPYLVAQADSGDMGGTLSHEFHFPTTKGEDNIISCTGCCGYVANEELAESPVDQVVESSGGLKVWRGISRDRRTLINVWYPTSISSRKSDTLPEVNMHAIKAIVPEVDASIENSLPLWADSIASSHAQKLVNLVDGRISGSFHTMTHTDDAEIPYWPDMEPLTGVEMETISFVPGTQQPLNLLRIQDGDKCPSSDCGSSLRVEKAIELGHTFHLGTRYSNPLKATVAVPRELQEDASSVTVDLASPSSSQEVPMQMGCHGIGVSRIIGAVADTLADEKGLNWPRVIAPYEVVVLSSKDNPEDVAVEVFDILSASSGSQTTRDVILDDRAASFAWKMRDADLVGYPIIVVVGRAWKMKGMCEVQCRRLEVREEVALEDLPGFVDMLLDQL